MLGAYDPLFLFSDSRGRPVGVRPFNALAFCQTSAFDDARPSVGNAQRAPSSARINNRRIAFQSVEFLNQRFNLLPDGQGSLQLLNA